MSKKSNLYQLPPEPKYEFKEDQWFIPPSNAYYVWYKNAFELLQSARSTYYKTKQCPSCSSTAGVTQTPRSIECANCNWKIDLRYIMSITPKVLIEKLTKRLALTRRMLYQIKYEVTFREVELQDLFKTLKEDEDTLTKQLIDLEANKERDFLLTTA